MPRAAKEHVPAPWENELLNKLRTKRYAKKRTTIGTPLEDQFYAIQVRAHREFALLLNKACRVRGINRASYLRRAAVQVMAKDLGMHPLDLLALTPFPRETKAGVTSGKVDDGTGFESWCPHPDCDGTHLVTRTGNQPGSA